MSHSKNLEHYHNKAEQDYENGSGYNPPYGSLVHDIFGRSDKEIELDNAYDAGWRNAKNQDKD